MKLLNRIFTLLALPFVVIVIAVLVTLDWVSGRYQ
jgi:hypothetical protein